MKIRNGDTVLVISGKDKGKTGTVLRVLPAKNRAVVSGINMRTKHVRALPQQAGERIQYEASIHQSNIMLVDPKTKKRTRIGFTVDSKGKKHRIAKKSGEKLPATKAGVAPAKKKTETKAEVKKDDATETTAKKAPAKQEAPKTAEKPMPDKKPFWKRAMPTGEEAEAQAKAEEATQDSPKKTEDSDSSSDKK